MSSRMQKAVEGLLVAQQESSYKAQNPGVAVTPEIQAEYISYAKEASATIAADGIPPAGTIIGDIHIPGDFRDYFEKDK